MSPRRSNTAIAACLAWLALLTWLDLATKDWAASSLPCDPESSAQCRTIPGKPAHRSAGLVVIPGYVDLSYAENPGAAFGILREAPAWLRASLFTTTALVFTSALLWMFVSGNGGRLFAWSVPLIASGALGNMIDRWRMGYVVDFIRCHLQDGREWPTFNVADCTITIGLVLLLIDGIRQSPRFTADPRPSRAKTAVDA